MSARLALIALSLLLAACARAPKKPSAPPVASAPLATPLGEASGDDPCAVIYEHSEADYTPGGLYRPGQRDSGPARPPDLSRIPEPVPRAEPRARYGNRSPYTVLGKTYHVMEDARGYVERGIASWYGQKFHGRPTSSLEPYDMCQFTAAHKTLPLPSYVRVTNLENGRSIIVRVNDRGPFHEGRIIDLSYVAALKLGVHAKGTAPVEVRAIDPDDVAASAASVKARPARSSTRRVVRERATRGSETVAASRWLQVGSFGERDNAQRLAARLESAGIGPVELRPAEVDGRRVWRVRVGPVSAAEAEALGARLRDLGMGSPRLLSE
ncbi:septal ring lytic transglycosylase RlpA family protein [Rehaibacterium terrae]|jgi:rare lipoprotein A|uniref:Endolytic peptidoglycan transglycosylase RlpA n=1 Tax=Rehaibacterium terrae TaxID=1341696 RepID=A0A7W7V947_9GAMM|nr:septal ring lytic transglycosylase RlpA family protein [Rehaibacterium terrae]MBB5014641.1 rare lipoprotein A [Rehaibacterium terrae]